MIDWFRSWHGAPTDPKWLAIGKLSGVSTGMAVAIAWALMDRASQADDRGSITGYDVDGLACFFGCEPRQVDAVVSAMNDKGMLRDGRFVAWERRQPKREDNSAQRTREWRKRAKPVTHGDAAKRTVTHGDSRGEEIREDISYANAYSSETSSDTLAEETPKRRKRVSYPPDFEAFWTAFPTDALMSKKAAGLVWSRMTEDVRQLAMSSLPAFRAYCTSKPDYRPVHAVRYLTQERFVGFSEVVSKAAGKVFVAKGTPQWTAWQRVQHSSCVTSAEHRQDGWWFESEWPNGDHSAERKTA